MTKEDFTYCKKCGADYGKAKRMWCPRCHAPFLEGVYSYAVYDHGAFKMCSADEVRGRLDTELEQFMGSSHGFVADDPNTHPRNRGFYWEIYSDAKLTLALALSEAVAIGANYESIHPIATLEGLNDLDELRRVLSDLRRIGGDEVIEFVPSVVPGGLYSVKVPSAGLMAFGNTPILALVGAMRILFGIVNDKGEVVIPLDDDSLEQSVMKVPPSFAMAKVSEEIN